MTWRSLALWASVFLFWCAGAQKRKPGPASFELVEFKAQRAEDRVLLDGRLRNTGASKVRFLVLVFHFLSSDKQVVSTRKADIDPDEVGPGEEAGFMLETPFPSRAVAVRMETWDKEERWYPLRRSGPHPIE